MGPRSSRARLVVATLVVGVTGAAGCADDSTTAIATSTTAPAVTTTVPSTTAAPAATTTAPLPPAVFPNPTAAAKALFGAWTKRDRPAAGALRLAPPDQLDALFAHPALPAAKLRSCDDGAFGSASCFFGNGQGGVSLTLKRAGSGWSITNIDAY